MLVSWLVLISLRPCTSNGVSVKGSSTSRQLVWPPSKWLMVILTKPMDLHIAAVTDDIFVVLNANGEPLADGFV